jgi:hypothetical protein
MTGSQQCQRMMRTWAVSWKCSREFTPRKMLRGDIHRRGAENAEEASLRKRKRKRKRNEKYLVFLGGSLRTLRLCVE